MEAAIHYVKIDVDTGGYPPVVFIHQFDTWRKIYCAVYDHGERLSLDSVSAKFSAVVPDGFGGMSEQQNINCTISGNGKYIICDLSELTINGYGEGYITVAIVDGSYSYQPINIRLVIQRSAAKPTDEMSDYEKFLEGDWNALKRIVQSGHAQDYFSLGDEINVAWTDRVTSTTYNVPLVVVSFQNATKQGANEASYAMWLQWKYAKQFPFEYDTKQAFYYASSALSAGTYHFTWNGTSYQITTTKTIPAGGCISSMNFPHSVKTWSSLSSGSHLEELSATEGSGGTNLGTVNEAGTGGLNSLGKVEFGSNKWSTSAMRQHLNSSAGKGAWWSPQTNYTMKPLGVKDTAGFFGGYEVGFRNIIDPVQVSTQLNTIADAESTYTYETTYDRVFLAAQSQMCFYGISEGAAFEYWVNRIGSASINDETQFPNVYSFEDHNEVAKDFWLRTPATWSDSYVTLLNYTFQTNREYGRRVYLYAGYYGDPEGYAIAFTPIYAMPVSVIC